MCAALIEREGRQAARPRRRRGGRRHPAHRQRPDGRRHPPGLAVARPRPARLRAVRLRRRRPAACHGAGARARRSRRCWCRRGPASPTRSAASSPTCATTMCAPSTSRLSALDDAPSRAASTPSRSAEGRATHRSAKACRSRAAPRAAAPTCSSRARATSCRSASTGRDIGVEGLHKAFAAAYWRALRHRAAGDPAGAGQPAHRGDRRAAGDFAWRCSPPTERAPTLTAAQVGERRVWFATAGTRRRSTRATSCRVDAAFDGPAILEQLDCTTVVEPGDRVSLDKLGNLLISLRA